MTTWKVARSKRPTLVPLVAEVPDAKGNLIQLLRKFASKRKMRAPLVTGFPSKKGNFSWIKFLVQQEDMVQWLKLSGAEDLFFRQFFDKSIGQDQFLVKWLKVKPASMQPRDIWDKLSPVDQFYGLVRTNRGLGVRILKNGSFEPLSKILSEGPFKVKEALEGLKWWKLEKLSDEEVYDIKEVIHSLGLELRGGVNKTRQRRFWSATFQAFGTPQNVHSDTVDFSRAVLTEIRPKHQNHQQQPHNNVMVVDPTPAVDPTPDLQAKLQEAIQPYKDEIKELKQQIEAFASLQEQLNKQMEAFASLQTDFMVLQVTVASLLEENKNLKAQTERLLPPTNPPKPEPLLGDTPMAITATEDSQTTTAPPPPPPPPRKGVAHGRGTPEQWEETKKKREEERKREKEEQDYKDAHPHRDWSREYYMDPAAFADVFPSRGRGRRGGRV